MPSWWGRKSAMNRDHLKENPIVVSNGKKSIDDSSSSGFSSFDSDQIGHPLPHPSISPTTSLALTDLQRSASVSSSGASSVSSAGDHNLDHGQFRGCGESKFSPQPRSPGPVSRVETATTSPRLVGSSLDSPNKRLDECHPLPLPPPFSPTCPPATRICSSPSSPAIVSNVKSVGVSENSNYQLCKWKKGRLLGRGTFGHEFICISSSSLNSESGQMCAIKEVREKKHSVYLEYVSGGSIHKLLQEYGPFREPVVMNTNGYNLGVDIWSLGCTVLEMATSKPPWDQYEGVAAIFKIGNSKDMPDIPDHLSDDAKSFIKQCLQRNPSLRPTASKLLDHPFVCDQATTRVTNVNLTNEAFPSAFDGSRTPTALEMCSNRNTRSFEVTTSKATMLSPRQNGRRAITSLPVSPSSSPMRLYGPAYTRCYLSPPHPSYTLGGQSSHTFNEVSREN
ncbi:hypothetical protein L1987_19087 [Smallanthus sonchifolius]|uniref:Uncharacterized protein n=1 Tax=Smallanthus sonchifolius TaxID=185202 RepID=A0ACB9J231_9ASTR|nr:hypothetical protein L1987_19087 [Smallanthus sonchifolius]